MHPQVQVKEVSNRKELREFVRLPLRLYHSDPNWVPPLWRQEQRSFTAAGNALLSGSEYCLLLALSKNGTTLGRLLVFIQKGFNRYYNEQIGFVGCLEVIPELEVAARLLATGCQWLKDRGMERVRGPIHQYSEVWGFVCEGYDVPPVFLSPYNPPYYNDFMEALGFAKVKDLLVYEADAKKNYLLPSRFVRFGESYLKRHPQFKLRPLNLRCLEEDARHIWRISNEALAGNWGYVPVAEEELKDLIKALKILIDPDAVWFVEKEGKPIGYCLGFPDLNVVLKKCGGKLFPRGLFELAFRRQAIKNYRLFGLAVLPPFQGQGLDVLLYLRLYEALKPKGIRLEANYILEDNFRMRNPLEKLNLKLVKKYRIYEKALS